MQNKLLLASQSKARQQLLDHAQIPYSIIQHNSNECPTTKTNDFYDLLQAIAEDKMKHLLLPEGTKNKTIFVLTADTLVRTIKTKQILGKPKDIDDAKRMHAMFCREPVEVATACCLEKKVWENKGWETGNKKNWTTTTTIDFCVKEELLDLYFEKMPNALNACGGAIVEKFGLNFLRSINGSFSAVLGLPIYKLQQALVEIGFYEK